MMSSHFGPREVSTSKVCVPDLLAPRRNRRCSKQHGLANFVCTFECEGMSGAGGCIVLTSRSPPKTPVNEMPGGSFVARSPEGSHYKLARVQRCRAGQARFASRRRGGSDGSGSKNAGWNSVGSGLGGSDSG